MKKINMKNQFYIEFLNKDKNFTEDIAYFDSYEEAKLWATTDNFEYFYPDMVNNKNYKQMNK